MVEFHIFIAKGFLFNSHQIYDDSSFTVIYLAWIKTAFKWEIKHAKQRLKLWNIEINLLFSDLGRSQDKQMPIVTLLNVSSLGQSPASRKDFSRRVRPQAIFIRLFKLPLHLVTISIGWWDVNHLVLEKLKLKLSFFAFKFKLGWNFGGFDRLNSLCIFQLKIFWPKVS